MPLEQAAIDDAVLSTQLLLARSADVYGRRPGKPSALHFGVRSVKMLNLLLATGPKPDARDQDELTPLMVAARLSLGEAMRGLVKGGANPNAVAQCLSVLEYATVARWGNPVRLLRSLGATGPAPHPLSAVWRAERTLHQRVAPGSESRAQTAGCAGAGSPRLAPLSIPLWPADEKPALDRVGGNSFL